jgi:hypothetical protein
MGGHVRLPIAKHLVEAFCRGCGNFKGVEGMAEPLRDVFIVKCLADGEWEDENCRACTGTLSYVAEKYGPRVCLALSEYFSK